MSCVPFEQHTFEYGPRDYLNQFLSLISTLRGGQQRYLPLLLSKINDTLPTMPMPGYSMVSVPGSRGRIDEIYDSSNPNSGDSTPFGSPPPQPVGQQLYQTAYGGEDFKSLVAAGHMNSGFPMISSAAPYPGMAAASSVPHVFQDPPRSVFPGANFDPTG